jgi:protein ImuB
MGAPPRLTVVWCPAWPVAAAGCGADEAVAVVHANRVVACSRAASAAGIRPGHRRREAQARCPHVRLVAHDPGVDARAFQRVVEAVGTIVPRLELTVAGVLTFVTRGPSRYFGGDEAMAARVADLVRHAIGPAALAACGEPGVGTADGRFAAGVAARLAARHTGVCTVEPGGSAAFLAPRSLPWLTAVGEVPADQVELFRRLGLRSLGELAALPEPDVLARFGTPGVQARHLAGATDHRPPGAEDPPVGLVAVEHFDAPVHQLDAVVFAARRLGDQLLTALAAEGRVCTQVVVAAETDHGERSERVWSLSSGFSVPMLVERVRWQLDGWARTGDDGGGADEAGAVGGDEHSAAATAGIVQLVLEPVEVRADDGIQLGLWGGRTQADEWAQRAVARLAGLVGDDLVVVPEWRGGRHPADRYTWQPASLCPRLDPGHRTASAPSASRAPEGPWPGALPAPSPATVFPEPVAVEVVDGSGAAVTVSGRGAVSAAPARLGRATISAWAGPWVVEERWWDAARHRRLARFQLLTTDGRAFLAAVERRQWWVLAEYA